MGKSSLDYDGSNDLYILIPIPHIYAATTNDRALYVICWTFD